VSYVTLQPEPPAAVYGAATAIFTPRGRSPFVLFSTKTFVSLHPWKFDIADGQRSRNLHFHFLKFF
jgi:hypothetical protein